MQYTGAALALTAGLLTGAAMKPQLALDGGPAGPQILAGWSGVRSTGPSGGGGLAYQAYAGEIPDHVLGTDWKKLVTPAAAVEPAATDADDETYEPPAYDEWSEPEASESVDRHAAYAVQTSGEISFPSLDGGSAYDETSRAEATPIAPPLQIDEEAPPEATGDTTVER